MFLILFGQHAVRRSGSRPVHGGRRKRLRAIERLENRSLFATFSVNSLLDTVDANPGDGMAHDAAGLTTLRAAVIEANALASNDTILLDANAYNLTRAGADEDTSGTGDLDISNSGALTIIGAGTATTILDAGKLDRAFHVLVGANASFSGLTIRNGGITLRPGGSVVGGGIHNAGTLAISNAAIVSNTEVGILNAATGTLTITSSKISDNTFRVSPTFDFAGGGISNSGGLTIINCEVSGNTNFGPGAGVQNSGTMTIAGSTISNNLGGASSPGLPQLSIRGGAIFNLGTATITSSTLSGNSALSPGSSGGAISNESGNMVITNSTISGNSAGGFSAIVNLAAMTIRSTTIARNNSAGQGIGAAIGNLRDLVTLQNTIVARNTVSQGGQADFWGAATSLGNNLISTTQGSSGWIASDLQNVDPKLGPLADNGGPTRTLALLPDSPAIDAADNLSAPATDQRGNRRPRDGNGDGMAVADIGAFEFSVDQ